MKKKRFSTKKAKKAHRQGSSKDIAKWFLKPLLHYRPDYMSIRDWLDYLFGTEHRHITTYIADRPFEIKGVALTKYGVRASNFGYRKVSKGSELFVRTDARTPNRIDVEVLIGIGKRSRVFELSQLQWERMKVYLEAA